MVIKPGLIGNGRKTIFGESALESFAKNCGLEALNLNKKKSESPQENSMSRIRILVFSFIWTVLPVTLICAQDLSSYRNFQLGMNLSKAVEQAGNDAAQAKMIHERPAVIQEMEWRPRISRDSS